MPNVKGDPGLITNKEMMMTNSIQVDAICQLLIEKGIITAQEFFVKFKVVQAEYIRGRSQ
jgi:hypothetical protein